MMKKLIAAVAFAAAMPFAASAATLNGDIEISGTVNVPPTEFSSTGEVQFALSEAVVLDATGSIDGLFDTVTETGSFATADTVTVSDFEFDNLAALVWSGNGVSFFLEAVNAFDNDGSDGDLGFVGVGFVTHGGTRSNGFIEFSTQAGTGVVSFSSTTVVPLPAAGFLLIGGLGGLVALKRRKKAA